MSLGQASSHRVLYPIADKWYYTNNLGERVGPFGTADEAGAALSINFRREIGNETMNALLKIANDLFGGILHQHGPDNEWYYWELGFGNHIGPFTDKAEANKALLLYITARGGF